MKWEMNIGIETHIQLLTKSKIFSNSSTKFGNLPNKQANKIDLALPGTLPVINKKAIELAIKFGIAVSGKISSNLSFSRKNYFYPDLPKGYQITQFKNPIISNGEILFYYEKIINNNKQNKIKIIQLKSAHLEEDSGKLLYNCYNNMMGIDYNRSGNSLLEIITKPQIKSTDEAINYLKSLYNLVTWLNICDGNLQNGSFRSDINISVKLIGEKTLGTKCEIKNLNSFKFIKNSINYEFNRQIKILENGGHVIQETRSYNSKKKKTSLIRKKENEREYKYFLDPDLPIFNISYKLIKKNKFLISNLPFLIQKKLINKYSLSINNAIFLTSSKELIKYFYKVIFLTGKEQSKLIVKWLNCEFSFALKGNMTKIKNFPIKPNQFSILINNIKEKKISLITAKEIFNYILKNKIIKNTIINKLINSKKIVFNIDKKKINAIIKNILLKNPDFINLIKSGKTKIINYIFGKVMKKIKIKINPIKLINLIKSIINKK